MPPPGAKPASPQGKEKGEKAGKGGKEGGGRTSGGGKDGSEAPAQGGSPVAAAAAAAPGEAAPPLAKVGIPLEGCTVELVVDGLKGRSEFIRRAPLLVSHPKWPLLEGEQAFYLWAGAAAGVQEGRLALLSGGEVRPVTLCRVGLQPLQWAMPAAQIAWMPSALWPFVLAPRLPRLQTTPRPSSSGCTRWAGGARTARSWRPSMPCEREWVLLGLAGQSAGCSHTDTWVQCNGLQCPQTVLS